MSTNITMIKNNFLSKAKVSIINRIQKNILRSRLEGIYEIEKGYCILLMAPQ